MAISFNLSHPHRVVAANSHFYEKPTEPLYLNRTLQYHDLIFLCEGQWMITENETDYQLQKDDVLLLAAGHHHYTRLPCAPGTRTMCIHISCEEGDLLSGENAVTLPEHIRIQVYSRAKHIFEKIIAVFWSEQTHKQERLGTLFNQLILELSDVTENAVQPVNDLAEEMIELIQHGTPNIVCIQPFACLPNHVVGKGVIKQLKKAYPQANIVAVDYDPGASEVNQLNRIKLMLSTAKKNLEG